MANNKVKVKDGVFPIRYKGERFSVGEEFTVDEKHFNESTMELLEKPKKVTRTSKTSESE